MGTNISTFQKARTTYQPELPEDLKNGAGSIITQEYVIKNVIDTKIQELFPETYGSPLLILKKGNGSKFLKPIHVGVLFSGGPAPAAGTNTVLGLLDGLRSINPASKLYGFVDGFKGYLKNQYREITPTILEEYKNTGGFDLLGTSRLKLETEEEFETGRVNAERLNLAAIVIIGGDDSGTNSGLLAEYYKKQGIGLQVITCNKSIDGDLKNEYLEISLGFDTACKVYSQIIGNIARDAISCNKYWHFIKLMGRTASHIVLECALQTHPTVAIISEEAEAKKQTLDEIVDYIVRIVIQRAENGNNFGIVLLPEGLLEFLPEFKKLIVQISDILALEKNQLNALTNELEKRNFIISKLSIDESTLYKSLPEFIQDQMILDRDPHGQIQVSLIETEKLLISMVQKKLKIKDYNGKFTAQKHFLGYESRCAAPSNFDANYGYCLGFGAAALIATGRTGYMSIVTNTASPISEWTVGGIPIAIMMTMKRRAGVYKPVINQSLVDLNGKPFIEFAKNRNKWSIQTDFVYPGPIQYWGPICDQLTITHQLEKNKKSTNI